jgi:hypothetical protein
MSLKLHELEKLFQLDVIPNPEKCPDFAAANYLEFPFLRSGHPPIISAASPYIIKPD